MQQNKKNTTVFLRHGKVDLPYPSHEAMPIETLRRLGTQELDPRTERAFFDMHTSYLSALLSDYSFTRIGHSPSERCVSLASYMQSIIQHPVPSIEVLPALREIRFDLNELFATKLIEVSDIKPALIHALVHGMPGVESEAAVLQRVRETLVISPNGNILMLTHGYFMTALAACISGGGRLTEEAFLSIPRFNYFDGFAFDGESISYLKAVINPT